MKNKKVIKKVNKRKKNKINWRILGENFVFKHKDTYYKMPSFIGKNVFYRKNDSFEQAKINLELIQKYFGKVIKIAPSKIIKNSDGHFLIKQKEIVGHMLTKQDLAENYLLLSKFKKLVIINEIFWEKEGVFLDLLGSDFALQPNKVHNLITDGKDIYIFDFGLFYKKPRNFIFKIFSNVATKIQMNVIKYSWDK
ncbi:hypothetical protein LR004_00345 [Candidatus Gracilibacteria bacterium]|nr:hypothetical protein [Candidatus Gracilibacteria bacterium]